MNEIQSFMNDLVELTVIAVFVAAVIVAAHLYSRGK